jgi:histidinol-phosphate aminotransferase
MSYQLNQKLSALSPYVPVEENREIIHLDANESFLNLPKDVLEEIKKALGEISFNRYPDPFASELCKAFGAFYGVDPNHITAGNGSDELISVLLSAFLMRGETMITTDPDFSMYTFYPHLTESNCILLNKPGDGAMRVEDLIRTIKENNARLLLFSNPCNPTGLGLRKEDVHRLITSVDALVVLDEAYMDFWECGQSFLGKENQYDNLIILRTCSKMGLAAARLGFAVANQHITDLIRAVKSPYNVNVMTQRVGTIFLNHPDLVRGNIQKVVDSRRYLEKALQALKKKYPEKFSMEESVTNFLYLRLENAKEIYEALLQKGISVRCFPQALRVTAGSPTENEKFLEAFEALLKD